MLYSKDIGSERQIPANFSLVFSESDIKKRIKSLGEEIGIWCGGVWQDSHTDVLTVPVLRGGIFFFADLVRAITSSVEIAPVWASSYESDSRGTQKQAVEVYAERLPVKGRVVLIVDDVCDSGRTLEELERALLARGAREVRSVVLIRRLLNRPAFVPCWTGFQYEGSEWFVGYGMDDNERWRNLPGVHVIKRDE